VGKCRHDAFVRRSQITAKEPPPMTLMQYSRWKLERFFDFLRDRDDARLLKDIMAGGSRG